MYTAGRYHAKKMMVYEQAIVDTIGSSPDSPPGMTASKSSKSSSFHSISSDDNSVLSDANHFEDIGLDDDSTIRQYDRDSDFKAVRPNRFSPSFSADLRAASILQKAQITRMHSSRDIARARPQTRDIVTPKVRPTLSTLQPQNLAQPRGSNVRSTSTGALTPDGMSSKRHRPTTSRSASSLSTYRHRSPSPGTVNVPHGLQDPEIVVKPRRGSWKSTASRKSALQLEMECDEDEGDEIPEGLVLDNVPISPRLPSQRFQPISPVSSKSGSPDRSSKGKERVRSVGNGTPAIAAAQGSLRLPSWKQDDASSESTSGASSPIKQRAKSWTAALSELSVEAKALTEKLEEHADELQLKSQRSSTGSLPSARRAVTNPADARPRHNSALPELPPLRRSNIMIDPLPVSKEKEAVLSRTRPSWLPPKDPAEERRHLKEYQKMMAYSIEAEKRREATKQAQAECHDTAVTGSMQTWEQDIIPRWNEAIRERRTRELWWRGIAPRSRGAVWTRAIGNELGLTEASFDAALRRAREVEARNKAGTAVEGDEHHMANFASIRRDVQDNTWRDLKIFQAGAPLHQGLVDVLMAYTMYRSDIGHVTGCNTVAALLLLNLPGPASAFVALANLLNRPMPLSFYASDPGAKASAYGLLLQTLAQKAPALYYHITNMPNHDTPGYGPDFYFNDVFTSLFTGQLALDQAARLFDVYVFEGDAVLVRAGVAFLIEREAVLLGTKSIDEVQRAVLGKTGPSGTTRQVVVAKPGDEDRWMKAVRDAGKVAK